MVNFKEILEKTGLSISEIKLIKKVALISAILSISIVVSVYIYYYFSLQTPKETVSEEQLESQNPHSTSIDIDAHIKIAQSYLNRGKPADAIPHLRRAYFLSNKDISTQYLLALALLEAGYYKEAYENFSSLASENLPDSMKESVSIKTGITLYYMGNVEESTEKLKNHIKLYPNSAEAWCFLGQIETFLYSDTTKIRSSLEKAVTLDSSYVEGWYQLGRFEMTQGDTFEARKHLLFALELNPLHIKSHARLGMIYFYMGNNKLAISSYRTALALNPADYNTRYNLGELLYMSGDTINALKEFTHTLEDNPNHIEANFKVGLISMRNNMFKEAIRSFKKSIDSDPTNIRILLQLAVSYEKMELVSDAIAIYRRILSLDEFHPIAQQKVKLLLQPNIPSTKK